MSAPALILLSDGSLDERVTQVMHAMRKHLQELRPELSINLAFLDHCPPTGPQVITTLANRGVTEVIFVPLSLTRAFDPGARAEEMLDRVRRAHPQLKVRIARPIGPSSELLNVLDLRLRNALASAHALELDALVMSIPDGGDTRGAALISRRARQWAAHHRLPVVVAHGDGSGPGVVAAINNLREQGRRAIAIGSFHLTADECFHAMAEQAMAAGAIGVSAPLGCDLHILDLAMARYAYAAMDLLDDVHDAMDDTELDASVASNQ